MAKNSNKQSKNATVSKSEKKGATYTFGGEYYARQDKGLSAKTYELAVTFPELLQAPLSVFKKGVSETGHPIRNLMVKKYSDFTSVRTYNVIKVENNTNTKAKKGNDIGVMDIEQLKAYISENDLTISTEVYGDAVDKVRAAITLALEDPEKFAEKYAQDVKDFEYKKQLEDLNGNDDAGTDEDTDADDLLDDLDGDDAGTDEDTDADDLLDDLDGDDAGTDE